MTQPCLETEFRYKIYMKYSQNYRTPNEMCYKTMKDLKTVAEVTIS